MLLNWDKALRVLSNPWDARTALSNQCHLVTTVTHLLLNTVLVRVCLQLCFLNPCQKGEIAGMSVPVFMVWSAALTQAGPGLSGVV